MRVVILQSNYLPWKGYFNLIQAADVFVFYDCVKYTKNDWRNRNQIYTKNGKQWISIPIAGSSVNQAIDEVLISDDRWQKKHYYSLYYGYRSAPCFKQLEEFIEDYLVDKCWNSLSQLNQYLTKYICRNMDIQTKFEDSRSFDLTGDRVDRLIGIVKQLGGTEYISGKAAMTYMAGNEFKFEESNIKLTYYDYPKYPKYEQLYTPFDDHVSIVDLIANIPWSEMQHFLGEETVDVNK